MQLIPKQSDEEAKLLAMCIEDILPANPNDHGIYFRDVCGRQERVNGTSPCNLSEAKEVAFSFFLFIFHQPFLIR